MAFGLSQLALPACAIRDSQLASTIIVMAAENYFNNNLMTTHDPHRIFNADMSGAFPAIVMNMLVYSDVGVVDLLPACPDEWDESTLKDVSLRGGICMNELAWKGRECVAVLTSKVDQTITLSLRGSVSRSVTLKAGMPTTVNFD